MQVKETLVKFEERLWSIIRNFVTLGRDNPAALVNAVRIVELQEMVDAKLEASTNSELPHCGLSFMIKSPLVCNVELHTQFLQHHVMHSRPNLRLF